MTPAPILVPVAIVTGAGAGLGAAMSQALTARGHAVVGISRRATGLAQTKERCAAGLFHAHAADVSDAEALRQIVIKAERDIGPITILINNAAVYHRSDFVGVPAEEVTSQIAINLGGYINAAAAVLPVMAARGHGRIIHVGSFAGDSTLPGSLAYNVSKFACRGFDTALVAELALRLPGLIVSEWIPGILSTAMGRADGIDPDRVAAWGVTLALDTDPTLHGARFLRDQQMLPERSFKRRIKDMLLLRPAPRARILRNGP